MTSKPKKLALKILPLLTAAAVFAVVLVSCGTSEVVDRAEDGTAILIRSPQPDAADLASLHAAHGVRTVVNLRGINTKADWFSEEEVGVEQIGARWVHLRVSGSKAPTPEVVNTFFEIIEDRANWPVLIHCHGGIHRTGLISALYRIQYQGWQAERAVAEMEDKWFDWTTRDRNALKVFLQEYERDPARVIDRSATREKRTAQAASTSPR